MNVPADRTDQVLDMILKSAESVGFLQTIKDRRYVNLGGVKPPISANTEIQDDSTSEESPAAQIKAMVKTVQGKRAIDDVLDAGRVGAVELAVNSGSGLSQAPR